MNMCDICDGMWKDYQLMGKLLHRKSGMKIRQELPVNASIKLRHFSKNTKITLDIKYDNFSDTSIPSYSVTL